MMELANGHGQLMDFVRDEGTAQRQWSARDDWGVSFRASPQSLPLAD